MNYTMAVFNEALRMFPPVTIVPKQSAYDTTLKTTDKQGHTIVVPCPAGTQVYLNIMGLHYNRRQFA